MKQIKLALDLELSLMKGILSGLCSPMLLTASELSKDGTICLRVAQHLLKKGSDTPLPTDAVSLTATQVYGADQGEISTYLDSINQIDIGKDAQAIMRIASEKVALTQIITAASGQLISGVTDLRKIQKVAEDATQEIEVVGEDDGLTPFSLYSNEKEWEAAPEGWDLESLPKISEATRGVMGIWIIAGEPGLGKSTLAWQIALDVGRHTSVVYYDLDGTGTGWMVERTRTIFRSDLQDFHKATEKVYYRTSIESLERDLSKVPAPALIVVDSVQTLPTQVNYRRSGIDQWLVNFKRMNQEGYTFLLISEVARWMYGKPGMAAFKETGELEYAGSVCAQLIGDPTEKWSPVEFHLLKSRHTGFRGLITDLSRDRERIFWFEEE